MSSPKGGRALRSGRFVALLAVAAGLRAETAITGRVTNENNAPVAGARVLVSRPGGAAAESISDQAGVFSCGSLEGAAEYRLSAERAGYFRLENLRITGEESRREIHVVLTPLREVYETIDVSASAASVGLDGASQPRSVSGAELLAVPFPTMMLPRNAVLGFR